MPLGYVNNFVQKESGNPYGASLYASRENTSVDTHLQAARLQGERLAVTTRAMKTISNR